MGQSQVWQGSAGGSVVNQLLREKRMRYRSGYSGLGSPNALTEMFLLWVLMVLVI